MKFIYKGNSRKSGVYKIINTKNGRIYIGSAKEFKRRAKQHFSSLKNNKHSNKFLQNDFNKCGEDAFEFHILEVIEGEKLQRTTLEQKHLIEHKANNSELYNFSMKVICNKLDWEKKKQLKIKMSKIMKERFKDSHNHPMYGMTGSLNPRYGKKHTPETLKKMSIIKMGNTHSKGKKHSKKAIERMSIAAKKRGISQKTLEAAWETNRGKKQSKELIEKRFKAREGYSHSNTTKEKIGQLNSKFYDIKLISPDGQIFGPIQNLRKFCKEHNLQRSKIWLVINEKRKHHQGWIIKK